jgi:hypothetical protein
VSRAALWLQLLILWAGAIALSAALITFDLRLSAPYKFFWLIPYPNLRLMWPVLIGAFREKPLLVTGGLLVPPSQSSERLRCWAPAWQRS